MKKYGEGSITVLSRVNNPDNLRHWVVRHSESLGMHATDVWLCKDRQETGSFGSQAPNQRQKPRKENQRRLERRSPSRSPRRLLRSPRAKKKTNQDGDGIDDDDDEEDEEEDEVWDPLVT